MFVGSAPNANVTYHQILSTVTNVVPVRQRYVFVVVCNLLSMYALLCMSARTVGPELG